MFTNSQIKEIQSLLSHLGIKDSQFKSVYLLDGLEDFILVQNENNKRLNMEDFVKYLKEVIEVPQEMPLFYDAKPVNTSNIQEYCTLKVKVLPEQITDATISINNVLSNQVKVLKGTKVVIIISKNGYKTISDTFVLNEDKDVVYYLNKE